jgi:ElaB/YqjD/DUF883 family membrane-anchored ribosome-binding protein
MNESNQTVTDEVNHLAADARALLAATADVAGEKVGEARKRLSAALASGRQMAGQVRDKAVAGAKATDEAIHAHPYQAIAIGIGLGAIAGYLLARRNRD